MVLVSRTFFDDSASLAPPMKRPSAKGFLHWPFVVVAFGVGVVKCPPGIRDELSKEYRVLLADRFLDARAHVHAPHWVVLHDVDDVRGCESAGGDDRRSNFLIAEELQTVHQRIVIIGFRHDEIVHARESTHQIVIGRARQTAQYRVDTLRDVGEFFTGDRAVDLNRRESERVGDLHDALGHLISKYAHGDRAHGQASNNVVGRVDRDLTRRWPEIESYGARPEANREQRVVFGRHAGDFDESVSYTHLTLPT